MGEYQLNRQLVLEDARRTPDGAGGYHHSWVALGTLWASVQANSGRERAGEDVSVSQTRYRITVRAAPFGAPSRPGAGQRFRDGERIFRIISVADRDTGQRHLICFCQEEIVV